MPIGGGILTGVKLAFRSPYLLGICLYIWLYTTLSTFLYFEQAHIVASAFAESTQRTALFASIDLAVNALTILGQVFVTGRMVARFGLPVTLALMPAVVGLGFVTLGLFPVLAVLVAFQVLRRAGNYAIARPAREMLFTVIGREEKYKSKNFIDTVVYIWLYTTLSTFLYFEQAHIVASAFAESTQRTALFASIDLAVNALTILGQVFVTGRMVARFGLPVTLALMPAVVGLGFVTLGLFPVLAV